MPAKIGRRELIAALGTAAISIVARAEQPRGQQPAAKKRMAAIGTSPVAEQRIGGHPLATVFFEAVPYFRLDALFFFFVGMLPPFKRIVTACPRLPSQQLTTF